MRLITGVSDSRCMTFCLSLACSCVAFKVQCLLLRTVRIIIESSDVHSIPRFPFRDASCAWYHAITVQAVCRLLRVRLQSFPLVFGNNAVSESLVKRVCLISLIL